MRHLLLAALHAACVASFFASLLRDTWRSAVRLFLGLFFVMVGAVIGIGWLMAWIAPAPPHIP